jgi:hypothetical protein
MPHWPDEPPTAVPVRSLPKLSFPHEPSVVAPSSATINRTLALTVL